LARLRLRVRRFAPGGGFRVLSRRGFPAGRTGEGHLLTEPWVPPEFLENLSVLLGRLDQHDPAGLAHNREEFRKYGHRPGRHEAYVQLPEARAELVVAVKLLGAGAGLKIRRDTPTSAAGSMGNVSGSR
jgi:hypothetical protein